jgi:carbon monoxide dehydrogenase subunit G
MIEINGEIVVEKPVEVVFAFVSDPANTPRYQPDIVSSRVETPGPVRRGTRFSETMKMGPWKVDSSCEVVEHERPDRVTFEGTGRTLRYRCQFTFEPVPQGTRIRIAGTAQLQGWWRLMEPMMRAGMRKAVPQQLARMRACLNEDAGAQVPRARAGGGGVGMALVTAVLVGAAPVATAAAAEGAPAAPAAAVATSRPPEIKRTVDAFAGRWIMDTTIIAPGNAPQKAPLKVTCRETAGRKAVTCDMIGNIPGSGPMEAAFVVGFDTFSKRVHFMAITSDEEVHDHVCRWTDASTLTCDPLKGGLMGEPITEDFVITSQGQKLSFKSTMTLKDGSRIVFDAVGRRGK